MKILVVAELAQDQVRSTTHSAISFAAQAASSTGGSYDILALGGSGAAQAASALSQYGATKVLHCESEQLATYLAEVYAPTVAAVGADYDLLCATASSFGKDLMPRVAAKLDAAFAGDCSGVSTGDQGLLFKRPIFAGNAYGSVRLSADKQVATVRQSEFEAAAASDGNSPTEAVQFVAPTAAAQRVQFVSADQVKNERPELSEAKTIISGGRALKEDFFKVLEPLADQLGAAIGASRAACDAGYAPGDFQVGQTGKIVAPELYFAIGISGAIQHIAGMKGSKTIVAINKDPEAPIFQIADYGLVADLFDAVPALVEQLKARP